MKPDRGEIEIALTDHGGTEWYFDRQTGACVRFSNFSDLEEETDWRDAIEREPDRFLLIDPLPSSFEFGLMADFAADLDAGAAKASLERALSGRHPFRAFKDALLDFPAVREAWFEKRNAAMDWLEDNGIPVDPA